MDTSPREFIEKSDLRSLERTFRGFKHRFTTGDDIARLLTGIKSIVAKHGSLHRCFASKISEGDDDVIPAMSSFVDELNAGGESRFLIPCPAMGSACKRLNLYLRWMVRSDDVDPGGWYNVPASMLIIPLDTHIFRICSVLGLTERKQADMRTAREITSAFREIAPDDPVKYDFSLTRLGIRDDTDSDKFTRECLGDGRACDA